MSRRDPKGFSCIGCRSKTGVTAAEVINAFQQAGYSIQPVRADMVFGMDHARSACMHAQRSFDRGKSTSEDIMTEVARYLGCNRQLSRSLQLVKVDGEKEIVIVTKPPLKKADGERLMRGLGLERDDSVADATDAKAGNAVLLGIKSLLVDDIKEEVLERIALLEVER